MHSAKIAVVGSCMMDYLSYTARLPKAGETIHGSRFMMNFGGKGANQCVAAAKLGGQVSLIARVGADSNGKSYIDNLKALNVDVENVLIDPIKSTGIAQIIVSEDGENQIVIVSGANEELTTDDLESCKKTIEEAGVLVCQLETSIQVAIAALKMCKGISILNGAPSCKQFPPQLLSLPSIFCVNEREAEDFTGLQISNIEQGKLAVAKLLQLGCKSVILTMGAEGALHASADNSEDIFHVKCTKVKCVDSTGAGDSFIGTLAFLLASGKLPDIKECIKIACFVASDSVTRPGTQISYPSKEILENFDIFINY